MDIKYCSRQVCMQIVDSVNLKFICILCNWELTVLSEGQGKNSCVYLPHLPYSDNLTK